MNVAFEPWIPVVNAKGERELASLCTVLTEGERFSDLAVRPHERVSLMRLLLCILHAALDGPMNYDERGEVPNRLHEAVLSYLNHWKDSFELFHEEKPWLQVAELQGINDSGKTSPVALLDFELATGNNSTLLDHGGQNKNRMIPLEQTALNLLTFQNFSPGGGSPVAQWKTVKTSQVGNPDAPCLSQSMAHCFFRGKSLGETIHLNLPTFEVIGSVYKKFTSDRKKGDSYSDINLGRPVWEFFPQTPDKHSEKAINATETYLGRLVPVSRWIRLIQGSNQMFCCSGFKYITHRDGFASEPTASTQLITKKDKKGAKTSERRVVSVEPSRALWRELSALLIQRSANGLGGPLAMDNIPNDSEFDFQVCAMTRDQASVDIAVESVFHITPTFRSNLPNYQTEVVGGKNTIGAEGYAQKLRWAIEDYRKTVDNDWGSRVNRTQAKNQKTLRNRLAQVAFLSYWTTVEKNLPHLMTHIEAIGTETAISTRNTWRQMLFSAACEAYKIACGQETPRQTQAFVKGWRKLTSTKKGTEMETQNNKQEELI